MASREGDYVYELRQRLNKAMRYLREAEDMAPAWSNAVCGSASWDEDVLNGRTTRPTLLQQVKDLDGFLADSVPKTELDEARAALERIAEATHQDTDPTRWGKEAGEIHHIARAALSHPDSQGRKEPACARGHRSHKRRTRSGGRMTTHEHNEVGGGRMRYRKLPVEIEAILNTGEWKPIFDWLAWATKVLVGVGRAENLAVTRNEDGSLNIKTLEGTMRADVGDWLICGVKGELYPCKPDVFAATYEPAGLGEAGS